MRGAGGQDLLVGLQRGGQVAVAVQLVEGLAGRVASGAFDDLGAGQAVAERALARPGVVGRRRFRSHRAAVADEAGLDHGDARQHGGKVQRLEGLARRQPALRPGRLPERQEGLVVRMLDGSQGGDVGRVVSVIAHGGPNLDRRDAPATTRRRREADIPAGRARVPLRAAGVVRSVLTRAPLSRLPRIPS